ncbi:uncharacterized protein ARMOST_21788 [Armillaria ostoyae]|uniref:Uncharacterized protein n=1 Tax=Armillaria ostoyae TaxID=47428 RepID=A0A284SB22_ARMOS|nr:uncharacterized protein ARMOST_21788 [Armillaria ostoyae]
MARSYFDTIDLGKRFRKNGDQDFCLWETAGNASID